MSSRSDYCVNLIKLLTLQSVIVISACDFDGVKNVLIEVRYQNKGIVYE